MKKIKVDVGDYYKEIRQLAADIKRKEKEKNNGGGSNKPQN